MFIPFGKAKMELSEKGFITDILFEEKSIFPKGQISYLLRMFKKNAPAEAESVFMRDGRLIYRFAGNDGDVKLRVEVKQDYTVFEVEECPDTVEF